MKNCNKLKTAGINVRIEPEHVEWLEKYAEREDRTISQIVRLCIKRLMEEDKNGQR